LAITNAEKLSVATSGKERAEALLHVLRDEQGGDLTIVGHSGRTAALYEQARRVANKDVSVLLVGETGTGKEVFARLIHASSPRADQAFVPVNIGALPSTMVESELFGHEKGAFTGAEKRRLGRFELAHGGTLFLDEVLDIPAEVQPKLLRVLEQRTFERLGSNQTLQANSRIICACNKDPASAVAEGRFREDLYYRLNTVTLELPPLRERRADIIPLLRHFVRQCGSDKEFDDEALATLAAYDWPGNVRELRNCVEAIDAMIEGAHVRKSDLPAWMREAGRWSPESEKCIRPLAEVIAQVEREQFVKALEFADGNNEKAMRLLGISRAKFYDRKREFGL
ncbi:MAG: sigma-54 interaction domain-containing protein, partial [Dehalococcoidia bacterium]